MEIKYDVPIEVNESQYRKIMNECDGIVAGREENGIFYIKVWLMKYAYVVRKYLK
jgi:hypothetical protein